MLDEALEHISLKVSQIQLNISLVFFLMNCFNIRRGDE